MALQTNDLGEFFAVMQATYGHRWRHGADSIPIWQEGLKKYARIDLDRVGKEAPRVHPDRPPALGQVIAMCESYQRRPGTYLEGRKYTQGTIYANRALYSVIRKNNSIRGSDLLTSAIKIKNELAAEYDRGGFDSDQQFMAAAYDTLDGLVVGREGRDVE